MYELTWNAELRDQRKERSSKGTLNKSPTTTSSPSLRSPQSGTAPHTPVETVRQTEQQVHSSRPAPDTKKNPTVKRTRKKAIPVPVDEIEISSDAIEEEEPIPKKRKKVAKVTLEDFDHDMQRVLLRAVREYMARLATIDAFPDEDQDMTFQSQAWEVAAAYLDMEAEVELTEDCIRYVSIHVLASSILTISSQISMRASTFRGSIKTVAKSHTRSTFGFRAGASDSVLKANKSLCESLLTAYLFTYKVRTPSSHLYFILISHRFVIQETNTTFSEIR